MSAPATTTANRTRVRRIVTGRPTSGDLVDAGFVLLTCMVALWGFHTTFDTSRFLFVAAAGLVLGIGVAHVARALDQSWFVLVLLVVVAFFLFGGAVALSDVAIGGVLPSLPVLGQLADMTVSGWRDLLTTLPPVDGTGQFLVLPYLLGLVFGAATFTWARRRPRAAGPGILPVILLAIVILLGTLQPAGLLVHGLGLSLASFLWISLRRRRGFHVVGTGAELRQQGVIGAVLLVAASVFGALAGGHLPGPDTERVILRTYVQPPFDVSQFPSPLVGFRKYTEGARVVWDQELFTVTGAPDGALIRVAVLDDYSGTVWSAAGTSGGSGFNFRKVGSTIAAPPDPSDVAPMRATVTIGAAYAGLADANPWVPSLGYPTSLVFLGDRSRSLAASVRYNPATGQALAPARLGAGDRVELEALPIPVLGDAFEPGVGSALLPEATGPVTAKAVKWADKKPTPLSQIQAVATTLKAGAYSDGTKTGETQFLPGHGLARLGTFLSRPQLVGNDEQYAATLALMANGLGVPARVVFGAVLPAGGTARGQDMHAWVELRGSDGRWYAVPPSTFVPDRNQTPQQQPQAVAEDANAADVPPPNAQRPPGSVDATFDTTSASVRPPTILDRLASMPAWVLLILRLIGYPVLAFGAITLAVWSARVLRRRRRQRTGTPSRRLAQAWRDYVDHARDLGMRVPAGLTRREQAVIVGHAQLARRADSAVFGGGEPAAEDVAGLWAEAKRARDELTRSVSRRRRWASRWSLRGLLFRDPRPSERPGATEVRRGASRFRVAIPRRAT